MEKRHTPKPGFPFIVDNEFDIDNYQFPELPSMFLEIDRPMGEDDITKTDFTRIFRRVADEIGRSIQDAFHLIPPNGVLAEISRKFKSLHDCDCDCDLVEQRVVCDLVEQRVYTKKLAKIQEFASCGKCKLLDFPKLQPQHQVWSYRRK